MNQTEFYQAIVADPQNMLQHYGVLGMKWGIRRYQNPDGTLTALGKKHLDDGKTQEAIDKWNLKKNTAIAKGNKKFVEKNLDYMTNDDIYKFNERLRARNTISSLKQDARKIDSEKIKTWMNTASNIVQNAANMGENGVKLYNTVAKINNAFSSKKMKLIKENDQEEKPKPEAISRFFDENGNITKSVRTWTNEDGNKVTDSREYKKVEPKKDSDSKDNSGSGDNAKDYADAWSNYGKTAKEDFGKSRANAWSNAYKNAPEHVKAEVVDDGSTRKQHESRHDTSTVEGKWKDVTPSTALTIYQNYRRTDSGSSNSSNSNSNSSKSSSTSSSGGFKDFKNNWTESAAKGYQDVDDYTEELLRRNK